MHGWAIHLTVFPWPMQQMLVWSEPNYLPRSGSWSQFSLKSRVAAMCTVMGRSTTPAAISVKADFSNFIVCWGIHFFFPLPKRFIRKPKILCLLHVPARSTRWSSNTLNWFAQRRLVGCLGAVLSFGNSCGLFLAQVMLGGNSEALYC